MLTFVIKGANNREKGERQRGRGEQILGKRIAAGQTVESEGAQPATETEQEVVLLFIMLEDQSTKIQLLANILT
ncbi:hypothetical protein ILYODFUR_021692 [Ilyodon furcidens]|uniref:Uncharacterized protein n=1 Tax=Ilyodon furcidens TaxID=33524 RepID=A0ABV0UKA2_9TELE